ncbi:hypothetical protein [Streptomyces sp. N35]|uniref:hypothetical protein n=1 Tax=Streptomyces sp. N35 TaxID=2795730 RepID=UPI001F25D2ED|nr:hypothetical protein [Streptomyces sp. N35]
MTALSTTYWVPPAKNATSYTSSDLVSPEPLTIHRNTHRIPTDPPSHPASVTRQ